MKIYNFVTSNQNNQKSGVSISRNQHYRYALPMASGGEDMIELSPQALLLHQKSCIYDLHNERIRKIAKDLMPEIIGALAGPEFSETALVAKGDITPVSSGIDDNNDQAVLQETAERILGFLAG